jgi:hypothetical protein
MMASLRQVYQGKVGSRRDGDLNRAIEKESRSKTNLDLDTDEGMVEGVRFTPVHEVSVSLKPLIFHPIFPSQSNNNMLNLCFFFRSNSSSTPSCTCGIEKKLTATLTR